MAYSINDAGAQAALLGFINTFQSGGIVEIRDGIRPATSDLPATGIVLATIDLGTTAFALNGARSVDLVLSLSDLLGDATGSATWFRMYDNAITANAVCVLDGSCGPLIPGTADMVIDDGGNGTAINIVDKVTINTLSISL